jgi:chromate transporter
VELPGVKVKQIKKIIYFKDIFILAISSVGGSGAHLTLFIKRLVEEKKYLTHKEFLEIYSFCQILPGPTSTQTITAIGYRLGGPLRAFTTLLIWVLPACILMILLSIFYNIYQLQSSNNNFLEYIQPMAVGFIIVAAIKIYNIVKDKLINKLLYFGSALLAMLQILGPYAFPIIIVLGGYISYRYNKNRVGEYKRPNIKIRWRNLTYFFIVFVVAVVSAAIVKMTDGIEEARPFLVFENSYRFGSLVFGGGNVLITMMYEQFVEFKAYLTAEEFVSGVGFVQAVPGPVFSLSAYTGGMIMKDWGIHWQIIGGLIGTVAIFLPGALFIMFLYPIWNRVKKHPLVTLAFEGIAAASAGLVLAAAYLLSKGVSYEWESILVLAATVLLLLYTKLPSPIIVIAVLALGIMF